MKRALYNTKGMIDKPREMKDKAESNAKKCVLAKKKIAIIFLLSLFLCSCGSKTQESQREKSISEVIDEEMGDTQETEKNNIDINEENNESSKIDKSTISRETWIEQALQEEKARRVMPELYGAEDIVTYIAKTGGKAYKGTYDGDTYYLYLTATCNYAGYFTPYVTVVKEKDTSKNQDEFGGRENLFGTVKDETERFLDVHTAYKFGYIGNDFDRVIGDFIEREGEGQGKSLYFNSGTDVLYTFSEDNPNRQPGEAFTVEKEIQFSIMEPDEAKFWYSQNALDGDWDDFMYYDGYYDDYYVRVEFTDGQNKMDKSNRYYMTVLSSVKDLDTFEEKKFQVMTKSYSYNEFSKLEDDEFMLEFISDRQAVLTNKQTGTSALVKYYKGYLTENKDMKDSEFYFYDNRMAERHDYEFEGKDYTASDGTIIRFSVGSSWVNAEDITDAGERTVDIYYQGGKSTLTAPVQIVKGNTLRIIEESTHTDLLFIWSDDNHFEVEGTGDYVPEIDGLGFYYEENQLNGY